MTPWRRHDCPPELEGLRQPVPVEERPGEEARRNAGIEATARAIRAEKRRRVLRRRGFVLGAAALALLAAGAGSFWAGPRASEKAPAVAVTGSRPAAAEPGVELSASAGSVVATVRGVAATVRRGDTIRLGAADGVRTDAEGAASLALPRGSRVKVGSSSQVEVVAVSDVEQRLRLEIGTTDVSVPESGGPRTFAIRTPDAEVVVHGTMFAVLVERDPSGSSTVTSVRVTRGAVLVLAGDDRRLVRAGEGWSSRVVPDERDSDNVAASPNTAVSAPVPPAVRSGAISRGPGRGRAASPAPVTPPPTVLTEQNRLFQAFLNARKAGNDALAIRHLDELLARFPNTPLAQEARIARFRARERLHRGD